MMGLQTKPGSAISQRLLIVVVRTPEAVVIEARSASEAVEEGANERRRVHGQPLVDVIVAGKELVQAGVIAEVIDDATRNVAQTSLDDVLEHVLG